MTDRVSRRRFAPVVAGLTLGVSALGLTVAGKLLAFGRDVVLSKYFGANSATDALFIANTIPGILWAAILVTINVVFLPLYLARRMDSERAAGEFVNEALQVYVLLALLMTTLCILGSGAIVHWTARGASAETLVLAQNLTIIMALGFVFSGYVGVQNAIQQATGHYKAPLAVPIVNNALAIAGVIAGAWFHDIRIAVIAAVGAWVIQAPLQRLQTRAFYPTVWKVSVSRQNLSRLALLSAPVMLGTFLDQVNIYIGIYLAGDMGAGAISHLNYASRLAMFLATTFSMLVSYFLFPRLAADATLADDRRTGRTLALGVLLIVVATLPPTVVSVMLRHDVVSLVYGRGALSPADLSATATAYAYFALGIVFIAVREIFNRLFFSHQRMVAPLMIGIVASLANYLVSRWLGATMGTAGVALGASVAGVVYLAGQVLVAFVWKPGLFNRALVLELGALVLAAVPAWWLLARVLPAMADWALLARLFAGGGLFTAVFLLVLAPLVWFGGFRRWLAD